MAYVFSGVICPEGSEVVMEDLQARFGGAGRLFEYPFHGWALAFAADHDDFEGVVHQAETSALVAWGRSWPSQDFVYMQVKCFGGVCEQRGFAFRDGEVLLDCAWEEERREGTLSPLVRLLEAVEAPLASGHFGPFMRDYFPPRQ
jgi:hypothetical protein